MPGKVVVGMIGSAKDSTKGRKHKKPKKPGRPLLLYTQELLVRGRMLNIQWKEEFCPSVNRDAMLASEFGTEIADVYARASKEIVPSPTPAGKRWKFLQDELGKAPKKVFQESQQLAKALNMDDNDVSYSMLLHEECRAKINGLCRVIKELGFWKDDAEQLVPHFYRYADLEGAEDIRRVSAPFGYHPLDEKDDKEYKDIFENLRNELKKNKMTLESFLDLSVSRIDRLEKTEKYRPENPNKLHVIIAAGKKGISAGKLEKMYHAFGLHPVGIEKLNVEATKNLGKALDLPADQIVYAGIRYFRPMISCVRLSKCDDDRPQVFWSLLHGMLRFYDEKIYAECKLNLCSQLFYRPAQETMRKNMLTYYENVEDGKAFDQNLKTIIKPAEEDAQDD